MSNLTKPAHAPAPDGTLGHDARSASQRTRLGAGAEGFAGGTDQQERNGRVLPYSLHDAMAEYGFPIPIEGIHRANTLSSGQLRTLRGESIGTIPKQVIVAPPLIERMAKNASPSLPAPCIEWIEDTKKGTPSWVWLRAESVESAMTAALLMLRRTELDGRIGRLSDFVALCRQAPLYGEHSREAIVRTWAQEQVLTLAVALRDQMDSVALEMTLSLLRQRSDGLLPTILAADALGAQILTGMNRTKRDFLLCKQLVGVLNTGLSGFSPDSSKSPRTIDLSKQTGQAALSKAAENSAAQK